MLSHRLLSWAGFLQVPLLPSSSLLAVRVSAERERVIKTPPGLETLVSTNLLYFKNAQGNLEIAQLILRIVRLRKYNLQIAPHRQNAQRNLEIARQSRDCRAFCGS